MQTPRQMLRRVVPVHPSSQINIVLLEGQSLSNFTPYSGLIRQPNTIRWHPVDMPVNMPEPQNREFRQLVNSSQPSLQLNSTLRPHMDMLSYLYSPSYDRSMNTQPGLYIRRQIPQTAHSETPILIPTDRIENTEASWQPDLLEKYS